MKVLAFAPSPGRGGVHRVIEVLLPALKRNGIDLHVLGQALDEILLPMRYGQGVPFTQVRPVEGLPLPSQSFEFLKAHAQEMLDHLAEAQDDYDLIFDMTPWWVTGAAVSRWEIGKPVVSTVPDFAFDSINMGSYFTRYFRAAAPRIADRSTHVIFSSDFQRHHGEDHYGFSRATTIHYCLDFAPDSQLDEGLPAGLPDEYLLAFHTMQHKDPETVLRGYAYAKAMARQRKMTGGVPPLVIGGLGSAALRNASTGDPQARSLLRLMNVELGLQMGRDVFVTGYVPDAQINPLYRKALAVIVASRSEGELSGSIHESIRNKAPLIYSDLPVFAEQLLPKVHGTKFPVGDWKALGEAIIAVLQDYQNARWMAERAFNDLSKRSVDDVAKDFISVFERVLAESKVATVASLKPKPSLKDLMEGLS